MQSGCKGRIAGLTGLLWHWRHVLTAIGDCGYGGAGTQDGLPMWHSALWWPPVITAKVALIMGRPADAAMLYGGFLLRHDEWAVPCE